MSGLSSLIQSFEKVIGVLKEAHLGGRVDYTQDVVNPLRDDFQSVKRLHSEIIRIEQLLDLMLHDVQYRDKEEGKNSIQDFIEELETLTNSLTRSQVKQVEKKPAKRKPESQRQSQPQPQPQSQPEPNLQSKEESSAKRQKVQRFAAPTPFAMAKAPSKPKAEEPPFVLLPPAPVVFGFDNHPKRPAVANKRNRPKRTPFVSSIPVGDAKPAPMDVAADKSARQIVKAKRKGHRLS